VRRRAMRTSRPAGTRRHRFDNREERDQHAKTMEGQNTHKAPSITDSM
jgi:hypothetical protein